MENNEKWTPKQRSVGEIVEAMERLGHEMGHKEPDPTTMHYPALLDVCREVFYHREEERKRNESTERTKE